MCLIPYDINRGKGQDIQDPIKSRVLCLINNGSLLLQVYEKSKRNVRTHSTHHSLKYNTIPYSIYQLRVETLYF